jgi:hypothetical protein
VTVKDFVPVDDVFTATPFAAVPVHVAIPANASLQAKLAVTSWFST